MGIFKKIYWNQYVELRAKGKEYAARKNGNILVTVVLLFFGFGAVAVSASVFPSLADFFDKLFRGIFSKTAGRVAGQIVALVLMGLVFLIVRFTIGRGTRYDAVIQEYAKLSLQEQEEYSKQGLRYFRAGIVSFFIGLFFFLFVG